MKREVPKEWADYLVRAKYVDRRNGNPSMSQLAEAANTHASTISAMMFGERTTSPEVVDRVAGALSRHNPKSSNRVRTEVHALVGRALEEAPSFTPHPDADLLSAPERRVVNELIALLAASKKQGGRAHGNATATNQPGSGSDGNVTELQPRATSGRAAARDEKKEPKGDPKFPDG